MGIPYPAHSTFDGTWISLQLSSSNLTFQKSFCTWSGLSAMEIFHSHPLRNCLLQFPGVDGLLRYFKASDTEVCDKYGTWGARLLMPKTAGFSQSAREKEAAMAELLVKIQDLLV